jgi:hypothetical protein
MLAPLEPVPFRPSNPPLIRRKLDHAVFDAQNQPPTTYWISVGPRQVREDLEQHFAWEFSHYALLEWAQLQAGPAISDV